MFDLPGATALSTFRIVKLLDRLRTLAPAVTSLGACFVHFIDAARTLSVEEQGVLEALLTYGAHADSTSAPLVTAAVRGELLLVVPRTGTISPWSSKATDIAHVCGLTAVRRIERGIAYRVQASRTLTREQLAKIAPVLFDRMTEAVLFSAQDATQL